MNFKLPRLKNIVRILPISIALAIIVSSCEKFRLFRCVVSHNPILEFIITPTTDTIRVGDTLTLKLACSSLLKDWKRGNISQFNRDKLVPTFRIYKLYDTTMQLYSDSIVNSFFNFKITAGQLEFGSRLKYEIRKDSLFFDAKIVPTLPGFYRLEIWHTTADERRFQPILNVISSVDDDCVHRLQSIMPNINNGDFTVDRAANKGFKLDDYWLRQGNEDHLWSLQNSSYYFEVVPR